MYKKTF